MSFATNTYTAPKLTLQVHTNIPAADLPRTYFVETWGNDNTALPARPDLPWSSPLAAMSAAPAGAQVLIGPGTFREVNDLKGPLRTARPGVTLRGSGPALTTLAGVGDADTLFLNTSNLLADLTTDFKIIVGPAYISPGQCSNTLDDTATNTSLCNVILQSIKGDGLYLYRWKDFSLTSTTIATGGDTVMVTSEAGSTQENQNPISTNSTFTAYGCNFGPGLWPRRRLRDRQRLRHLQLCILLLPLRLPRLHVKPRHRPTNQLHQHQHPMNKSPRTTAAGVIAIAIAALTALAAIVEGKQPDWPTLTATIAAGVGLILARDHTPSQ